MAESLKAVWEKVVRAAQKYTILGDEEPQRLEVAGMGAIPYEYSRKQEPRGSIYAPGRAIDPFGGGGMKAVSRLMKGATQLHRVKDIQKGLRQSFDLGAKYAKDKPLLENVYRAGLESKRKIYELRKLPYSPEIGEAGMKEAMRGQYLREILEGAGKARGEPYVDYQKLWAESLGGGLPERAAEVSQTLRKPRIFRPGETHMTGARAARPRKFGRLPGTGE